MRKIITVSDIILLFGKSQRQASRILAAAKKALGKDKHQVVTVREFSDYYGISTEEVEHIIYFNDN